MKVKLPLWVRTYRIILGILAIVAVIWNYLTSLTPDLFFRYFINQSNLIAGTVLILGATVFNRR